MTDRNQGEPSQPPPPPAGMQPVEGLASPRGARSTDGSFPAPPPPSGPPILTPDTASVPAPPPPPGASTAEIYASTRWGPVDVLLAVPVVFGVATVGAVIAGMVASAVDGWEFNSGVDMPVYALFLAVLVQQAAQGGWPWYVARTKGNGWVKDWGFRFDLPRDLKLGLGYAVLCVVSVGIVSQLMEAAVSLPEGQDPSNTGILSDNEGSPWLIGIVVLIVIGAPLSEELLFRGLVLRALDKALGKYVAIIGSTILFTFPHIQEGATWQETTVLLSSIATIGLILGIAADRHQRLGPAIIAHLLFNAFGTVTTLAT